MKWLTFLVAAGLWACVPQSGEDDAGGEAMQAGELDAVPPPSVGAVGPVGPRPQPQPEPPRLSCEAIPGAGRRLTDISFEPDAFVSSAGCSQNEFFIDTTMESGTPCVDFAQQLQTRLTQTFATVFCGLSAETLAHCAPNAAGLYVPVAGTVPRAQVSTVFSPRQTGPGCLAHDGHLRFFRVRFFGLPSAAPPPPGGPINIAQPMEIPNDRLCEILSLLRSAANTVSASATCAPVSVPLCGANPQVPAPAPQWLVGRECPAVPLESAAIATPEQLDWHVKRMSAVDPPVPAPAGAHPVNVALIDTGVDDAIVAGDPLTTRFPVGLPIAAQLPAPRDPSNDRHPHGSQMARLIRQVAPTARIHSFRVFDGNGYATTSRLAQAIEAATFDVPSPRILNLSLGWAPELGESRRVSGTFAVGVRRVGGLDCGVNLDSPVCNSVDDRIGEAARFALTVARRATRNGYTLAVAAAGNREAILDPDHPNDPKVLQALADRYAFFGLQPPDGNFDSLNKRETKAYVGLYYPARWYEETSGTNPVRRTPLVSRPVLPVGAVDALDRPSAATLDGALAALSAPGEAVFPPGIAGVRLPTALPFCSGGCPAAPDCVADDPSVLTLPRALAGTSISAALVTGLAARAQHLRAAYGERPLSWKELARLVYASGRELVPDSIPSRDKVATRRPDACVLDRVIANDPTCGPGVATAIANVGDEGLADGGYFLGPAAQVIPSRDCRACPAPAVAAPALPAVDAWPVCQVEDGQVVVEPFLDEPCDGDLCVDRLAAGALGPQPESTGCSDCALSLFAGAAGSIIGELKGTPNWFKPGTSLLAPRVQFFKRSSASQPFKPYGTPVGITIQLAPTVPFTVSNMPLEPPLDLPNTAAGWANFRANLVMEIQAPGASTSTIDSSVLTLKNLLP